MITNILVLLGILLLTVGPFILTKIQSKKTLRRDTPPNPDVDYDDDWGSNLTRRMNKINSLPKNEYTAPAAQKRSPLQDTNMEADASWDHYSDPEEIAHTGLMEDAVTLKKKRDGFKRIETLSRFKRMIVYKEIFDNPVGLKDKGSDIW